MTVPPKNSLGPGQQPKNPVKVFPLESLMPPRLAREQCGLLAERMTTHRLKIGMNRDLIHVFMAIVVLGLLSFHSTDRHLFVSSRHVKWNAFVLSSEIPRLFRVQTKWAGIQVRGSRTWTPSSSKSRRTMWWVFPPLLSQPCEICYINSPSC